MGMSSDDDCAFDPDLSIRFNETGGYSLFEEISLASEGILDIYSKDMCRDGDDNLRSEVTDTSNCIEDRALARHAKRDVSRSTPLDISTTARRTRSHTIGQGPPETAEIAQTAPTTNNNSSACNFEPYTVRDLGLHDRRRGNNNGGGGGLCSQRLFQRSPQVIQLYLATLYLYCSALRPEGKMLALPKSLRKIFKSLMNMSIIEQSRVVGESNGKAQPLSWSSIHPLSTQAI